MVAKHAGVSRGTVDRVINDRSYVKAEVRERIVQSMKALGYMPLRAEQAYRLGLSGTQPHPMRLGVLLPNWTGHFKDEVSRGIADAQRLFKDYQIDIHIEENQTDLPEETVERLNTLKAQGVSGIAMCAKDHASIVEYINRLHAEQIPVVTFNSDITASKRLCFVGQDIVRSGRVAGELMMKYISAGDRLLVGVGNPEFSAHKQRLQGFCEKITERGFDANHLRIIKTYNDYSRTYTEISRALSEDRAIKGIYMANRSTTACAEAVRSQGLQGKVRIICHDITDVSKRLLRSGDIDFALAQNIYNQGYRPLIILREYLQLNQPPDTPIEESPIEIICAENLIEYEKR